MLLIICCLINVIMRKCNAEYACAEYLIIISFKFERYWLARLDLLFLFVSLFSGLLLDLQRF